MGAFDRTAYSAADTVLGSVGESLLSLYSAATFTLTVPVSDHVQFSSDAYSFRC